jgi:hypothetical protein
MERQRALEVLGLGADASAGEVQRAYAVRSRVLKRRIVDAINVDERNRFRRLLSDLVRIRDCALGPEAAARLKAQRRRRQGDHEQTPADWWHPELGVPEEVADRKGALDFFGCSPYTSHANIREVFFRRSRELKRRIAHASDDNQLSEFRVALRRLNELLALAVSAPPLKEQPLEESPVAHPDDETLTDLLESLTISRSPAASDDADLDDSDRLRTEETDSGDLIPGAKPIEPNRRLSESVFDLEIEPPDEDRA